MAGGTPEETDHLINEAINRADADAVAALFEPKGVLVLPGGDEARGREAIRAAVAEFLEMKPRLTGKLRRLVIADNLAQLIVDWRMEGTTPDGQEFVETGTATDVMRRQPDGSWLYVIDLPQGGSEENSA